MKAYIEPEKCLRCTPCLIEKFCGPRAIFRIDPEDPELVEQGVCYVCGACISPCKGGAVVLREI